MSIIYEAVESYMLFKDNEKLFKMLKKVQTILPDINVCRLMSIVESECDKKHINKENFARRVMDIYNMLIIELSNIVKTNKISNRKIYEIESITQAKLILS